LPERLLIGHQISPEELGSGSGQGQSIQPKLAAKGGVGIVAQSLLVADGTQEQIQGPGGGLTITEPAPTDEALIQPAELGRNFAEAVGYEDFFMDHLWGATCGTASPSDRAP
jgi:hypothetical protein